MNSSIYVSVIAILAVVVASDDKDYHSMISDEDLAKQYLKDVNTKMEDEYKKYSDAQWAYATDINNQTMEAQVHFTTVMFVVYYTCILSPI